MNQESSEKYTIGYNKDESYLKQVYTSFKGELKPIWIHSIALVVLTGLDLILNEWMGWNELMLRTLAGASLLGISLFLRPHFPHHILKGELKADQYALVLDAMKNYFHITFIKLMRYTVFYTLLFLALGVLLRSEANYTFADWISFSWVSESRSNLIFFAGLFVYTLFRFQSAYSRLNKIEHI